jgi:hypothetical protein
MAVINDTSIFLAKRSDLSLIVALLVTLIIAILYRGYNNRRFYRGLVHHQLLKALDLSSAS